MPLHKYQQEAIDDVGKGQWVIYLGVGSKIAPMTLEGFYSGRDKGKLRLPIIENNQSKAKRFKTIGGE